MDSAPLERALCPAAPPARPLTPPSGPPYGVRAAPTESARLQFLLERALLAYVLLSAALLANDGALGPLSVLPFLGCLGVLFDTVRRLGSASPLPGASGLSVGRWAGLLAPLALLASLRPPGVFLRPGTPLWVFPLLTAAVLGLALWAVGAQRRQRQRDVLAAAMLLMFLVAAVWVLRASPGPRIDLYTIQQLGAAHLLAGRDPYAATYPNIYTAKESLAFFGAPLTELRYYPYPPLSLLVTTAGYWLAGDVRVSFLALHLATGVLLYAMVRRRSGSMAAGLLALHLLSPRGLFVLEQSWTEPLLSACVAAWAALMLTSDPAGKRAAAAQAVLLGLVFSAKQYSVLLVPLLVAQRFRPAWSRAALWRTTALAAGLAALGLLPFLLWHPRDLIEDLILFQVRQPFRQDALTLPALFSFATGLRAPGALALLGAAGSLGWAFGRLPRQPAGLLYGAAIGCFSFFAMAKQAFCNYYSFVGVLLLLCAAACVRPRAD